MESVDVEPKSPKKSCPAEVEAEERPSSPVNDCAICLEQLTDKSFTNSCFHMFCFHCLKAWSKVKPECPLCKQDFCSIIHNIRSMDDYDEYHVPPAPMRFASPDQSSLFAQSLSQNSLSLPFRDLLRQRDFFSPGRRFFSYRTTYIPGPFNVPRERTSRLVIQPYVDNLQIQNSYPSFSTSSSHTTDLTSRKNVYLKDLELRPSNDGRHRISSPEFYRDNEGQLHRLGRWVNRELAVISQLGVHFNPSEVFSLIMHRLPNYEIQSAMFHNSLYPHLGLYTRKFIKEFHNFAISPYDMEEYDRLTVYISQRTGSSLAFIVTVGSDESEEVQVIPSSTINHSTTQPWINLTRIPSSNYSAENNSRLSSTSNCSHLPSTAASSSGVSTSPQVIDISDSENDDCIIIDEVKSTLQTIVLDDSDTENADVGNTPKSPIPSTSGYRPPPKTDTNDNSSLLPSTSNNDSKFSIATTNSVNCCTKTFYAKCHSKRRSPSNDSVISTDNSIIDRESDKDSKSRKRKNSKPKKVEPRHTSFESYLSSSDSSFDCDDDNDSDWQANPKKKKKTRKHSDKSEKKTRKRKKTQHKSPKRKKRTDSESTHKSKRISKSHKSKKSSKSTVESHSNSSALKSASNGVSASSKHESDNFSPIRPKLRSVVKKVERSDYVDVNVPSTSYGIRCNGTNAMQTYMKRVIYSSDSD
ncbi:E3 ubiquitin-protein ligase Topors-like [Planococcus citri]|uniref:E3 ubiquitin-protein ligase Topors-like n=1 Tax=Planococcus citri TaxID=170843 RepID=UPI0031F97369